MRKLLNKLMSPFGYEVQRIDRFARQLQQRASSPHGVRFVQVGANDGVLFDTLYPIVTAHRCSGLVIEPLPDFFARLQANYAHHPQIKPINKAVHATSASMHLYRVSADGLRDLPNWTAGIASFEKQHLLKHGVPEHFIVEEAVACASLMTLLTAEAFLDADVLQIDVEGYDAEVIDMIDFSRFKPQLIKYEHKNLTANDQKKTLSVLKRHGYCVDQEIEDTVAWANAP
jgi:FkbM family methyltransferase